MQNEYTEIAQLLIDHTNDNNTLLHTPQENPPIIEIIAITIEQTHIILFLQTKM